jgi:peptide/nickel transport system permease protein
LSVIAAEPPIATAQPRGAQLRRFARRNPTIVAGGIILSIITLMAIAAPLFVGDAITMHPAQRLRPPSDVNLLGTDHLGRDIFARTVYGARVSLFVGVAVATMSITLGLMIGLMSGYFRKVDLVVMRLMDGLMAIPAILLAIAMVSLFRSSVLTVIIAITVPQIPGVVRLVRSIVLSVREEPYVEAAVTLGTSVPKLLWRHVLPNTIAPMIVQGTFICASAILIEAILSFLGIGVPPEIPTWGNIMAEGRQVFSLYPHNIIYPGVCLALTILAVNVLGDGLRDTLDPKMAKRV